jgi:large subunit ribosomal protein L10
LIKKDKVEKVASIKALFESNTSLIFTDHSKMNVEQAVMIRDKLAEMDATLLILKNTLALIAAKETFQDLKLGDLLSGPTSVIATSGDISAISKELQKFIKQFDVLKIKGGILEGNYLALNEVEEIASLPSKEVLIGKTVSVIGSPIFKLVSVLNALIVHAVLLLNAIADQKEKASDKN